MAVQISTVAFTSTLTHDLAGLSLTPDEISSLKGGSDINRHLPPGTEDAIANAYSKAIRIGLLPSLAWAGLALLFALALPWPRLKAGATDEKQKGSRGSDYEKVTPSILVPSTEADSIRDGHSSVSGLERNLLAHRLSFDSLHVVELFDDNGRWTGIA